MSLVGAGHWLTGTRATYDTVAVRYATQLRGALAGTPCIRSALALFTTLVHAVGGRPVADADCGPGHVTAHLHDSGLDTGIGLSPVMINVARREHAGLRFEVDSMTDLPLVDALVAGLIASWSLVHVPGHALPAVSGHSRRALRPGGYCCWAFTPAMHRCWRLRATAGTRSSVYVYRRQPADTTTELRDAGLTVKAHM